MRRASPSPSPSPRAAAAHGRPRRDSEHHGLGTTHEPHLAVHVHITLPALPAAAPHYTHQRRPALDRVRAATGAPCQWFSSRQLDLSLLKARGRRPPKGWLGHHRGQPQHYHPQVHCHRDHWHGTCSRGATGLSISPHGPYEPGARAECRLTACRRPRPRPGNTRHARPTQPTPQAFMEPIIRPGLPRGARSWK